MSDSQPGLDALPGVGEPNEPSPSGMRRAPPNDAPMPPSGSRGVPSSSRSFGSGSGVRTGMSPVYPSAPAQTCDARDGAATGRMDAWPRSPPSTPTPRCGRPMPPSAAEPPAARAAARLRRRRARPVRARRRTCRPSSSSRRCGRRSLRRSPRPGTPGTRSRGSRAAIPAHVTDAASRVLDWLDAAAPDARRRAARLLAGRGRRAAGHAARPERFAFAVNLSGYATPGALPGDAALAERRPPVFWGRGTRDDVIPEFLVEHTIAVASRARRAERPRLPGPHPQRLRAASSTTCASSSRSSSEQLG